MYYKALIIILPFLFLQCKQNQPKINETPEAKRIRQDSIITKYLHNCATNYNYRVQMQKWQDCLDQGLEVDSTVAYL